MSFQKQTRYKRKWTQLWKGCQLQMQEVSMARETRQRRHVLSKVTTWHGQYDKVRQFSFMVPPPFGEKGSMGQVGGSLGPMNMGMDVYAYGMYTHGREAYEHGHLIAVWSWVHLGYEIHMHVCKQVVIKFFIICYMVYIDVEKILYKLNP